MLKRLVPPADRSLWPEDQHGTDVLVAVTSHPSLSEKIAEQKWEVCFEDRYTIITTEKWLCSLKQLQENKKTSEKPQQKVPTCFILSSWFSFWHCTTDSLSFCSSWFSWEFSRHFFVCWADNTSSSLCNNWISFLQRRSSSTDDVGQLSEFWRKLH